MNPKRYIRQTILKEFGPDGQRKLADAKVLVVGAGGLGVPVLIYLNAMGVGTLGIVDADVVSISNLHRQVLYTEAMVGLLKVQAATEQLQKQNPETQINAYPTFLDVSNALKIIGNYDLVVDATDNFPIRYLINDACVILNTPFVYGALHGFEGQVSVFNYQNGPTYRCLFATMPKADAIPNCNENGVLGILPGIVGNLQALEVVKVICGLGEVLSGTLLLYDALTQRMQRMTFPQQSKNLSIHSLADSYDFELPAKSTSGISIRNMLSDGLIEVVDVRTLQEFDNEHLEGAKHIPLDQLEQRSHEIDLNKPVYLICQVGIRSQKAIYLLQQKFPQQEFINVDGGMNKIDTYANTH
ncbi:MAG: molybdopterin/thiamine biosynthesis adenylyltransferase/rhodanese-related sulfurtransferase [Maribacter sp.]|jgi:molybdopterin/thiamine biosynthesis adenylyltransferase/rhodanese-related sulfurtransferase